MHTYTPTHTHFNSFFGHIIVFCFSHTISVSNESSLVFLNYTDSHSDELLLLLFLNRYLVFTHTYMLIVQA